MPWSLLPGIHLYPHSPGDNRNFQGPFVEKNLLYEKRLELYYFYYLYCTLLSKRLQDELDLFHQQMLRLKADGFQRRTQYGQD